MRCHEVALALGIQPLFAEVYVAHAVSRYCLFEGFAAMRCLSLAPGRHARQWVRVEIGQEGVVDSEAVDGGHGVMETMGMTFAMQGGS